MMPACDAHRVTAACQAGERVKREGGIANFAAGVYFTALDGRSLNHSRRRAAVA